MEHVGRSILTSNCGSAIRLRPGRKLTSGDGHLQSVNNAFSIQFWVRAPGKPNQVNSRSTIASLRFESAHHDILNVDLLFNRGISVVASPKGSLSVDVYADLALEWRHISIAYEEIANSSLGGGAIELWIDGNRARSIAVDLDLRKTLEKDTLQLVFGLSESSSLEWFDVDNVRFFDYPLSPDQLSSILHARMCEETFVTPNSKISQSRFLFLF